MRARSSTRSNQRPDTLMQDRIRQIDEIPCTARPDHTFGSIASWPALASRRPISAMPRKLSSSACNASAKRSSTAAPFPRAATKRCGRNRSGGEWPCTDSTCRRTPPGFPSCDRSSCHPGRQAMPYVSKLKRMRVWGNHFGIGLVVSSVTKNIVPPIFEAAVGAWNSLLRREISRFCPQAMMARSDTRNPSHSRRNRDRAGHPSGVM
jgi:hypothetical protein